MEKIFQIVAAVLILVAAIFLWYGSFDGVFVSVALACVCYFLGFRYRIKESLPPLEPLDDDSEMGLQGEATGIETGAGIRDTDRSEIKARQE